MKRMMTVFTLFAMLGFLAGCSNTLNGAGQDIEKVGKKVQETF